MTRKFKARYVAVPISAVALFLVAWVMFAVVTGIFSWQWFNDRAVVANYQPEQEVASMVDASGMNETGKFYFYTGTPELNSSSEFNENCADVINEQSIVLGCYTGQIYIFDVTDERIAGVKDVTAAHEMLHAAYDRLAFWERERVDNLITAQLEQTTDQKILALVAAYDQLEPGYRTNELHSIFGTETRELSTELNEYYARYFSDRERVVAAAERYEGVFYEMEARVIELEQKMTVLESEINTESANYEAEYNSLSRDIDTFNAAVYNDETVFYARRNALIARQNQLNAQADSVNAKIDEYNRYVEELQVLGREAQTLQDNINSQSDRL